MNSVEDAKLLADNYPPGNVSTKTWKVARELVFERNRQNATDVAVCLEKRLNIKDIIVYLRRKAIENNEIDIEALRLLNHLGG